MDRMAFLFIRVGSIVQVNSDKKAATFSVAAYSLQDYGRWRRLLHALRLLAHFVEGADVEEGLFGKIVGLALGDVFEALERVGNLHVHAFLASELLGHDEGLAEEAFDLARPA